MPAYIVEVLNQILHKYFYY